MARIHTIAAIALFTDNDQTGDPAQAYYEWGRVQCDGVEDDG